MLWSLLAIAPSLVTRTGNPVHRVARTWSRSILAVSGIRVAVSGLERIDPARPYIFMSNHQSNFDIPVLLAHLPLQFRWLAKAELFKIPVFGRAMRGAGYISIDRADREAAFKSLGEAAETIRKGVAIMIFPEGTRSLDGTLKPFKKGGFVLAVDAGVPILRSLDLMRVQQRSKKMGLALAGMTQDVGVVKVKGRREIVHCEQCGRILYLGN